MTRHLASTRSFTRSYSTVHPVVTVTDAPWRPVGGALRVSIVPEDQPVGLGGRPYMGMDPSDPVTWVRPYNPQPGMIARLNFDGAKLQGDTPMGGTWHYPRPVVDRPRAGRGRLSRKARPWRTGR